MAETTTHGQLDIIRGFGHNPQLEAPDRLRPALPRFRPARMLANRRRATQPKDAMQETGQQLTHRLDRNPSVLGELRYWSIIALPFAGITAMLYYVLTQPQNAAPIWAWVAVAIGALITVGLIWDIVTKAFRGLTGRIPVVEIDRQPLTAGARAQLRVVEPEPASLDGLTVLLVAGAAKIERVHMDGGTVGVKAAIRISGEVKHHATLLALDKSELAGSGRIDRLIDFTMPAEAAGHDWRWRVAVIQHSGRGPGREHWFPIQVVTGVPQQPIPMPDFG